MIKTKKEACKAQPSENEKKKNQGFLEDCIKEIPQLNDCLICIFFFWDQCFGFYAIEKVLKKFIPTGGVFNIQRAWTLKRSIVTLRWIVNNYNHFFLSIMCQWDVRDVGSISVSGQLPTYPSPNSTTVNWQQVKVNVGFGEG